MTKIAKKLDVKVQDQKLMYKGKQLAAEKSLEELGIVADSVLQLGVKLQPASQTIE